MMPPSSHCPQCAAPLPPGAPKCSFCGFLTPWGAAAAAQQQQMAAHQQQQQALIADRDRRLRILKAESTAKTGLILAIVGLPICCGPVSLVGGGLAYKAANMAKAEGQPRPAMALAAMIIAVFSTITSIAGVAYIIHDQNVRADHLAQVRDRLKGKREAPALEAKTACDVIEEYVAQKGYGGEQYDVEKSIHCDGAFSVNDRRASVADVRFATGTKRFTLNACLERRSRWFVLKLMDGGSCADLPPAAPFTAPARQFSEEEATADEQKARDDLAKITSAAAIKAFSEKLAKVKASAAGPGGEKACAKGDLAKYLDGNQRRKVAAVDYDLLDASRAAAEKAGWPMLTSPKIREILDDQKKAEDRAEAVDELRAESGPLLVVYRAEKKLWPVITGKSDSFGKDFAYDGGEYLGWLFVYDVDSAARLCQTKLVFESSDEVSVKRSRLSSKKASATDAVMDDFKDNFETAATDAIKRAAPDLRLGYKVLE